MTITKSTKDLLLVLLDMEIERTKDKYSHAAEAPLSMDSVRILDRAEQRLALVATARKEVRALETTP